MKAVAVRAPLSCLSAFEIRHIFCFSFIRNCLGALSCSLKFALKWLPFQFLIFRPALNQTCKCCWTAGVITFGCTVYYQQVYRAGKVNTLSKLAQKPFQWLFVKKNKQINKQLIKPFYYKPYTSMASNSWMRYTHQLWGYTSHLEKIVICK